MLGTRTTPQEFGGRNPTRAGVGAHRRGLTGKGSQLQRLSRRWMRWEWEPEPAAPHTAQTVKETQPACNEKGGTRHAVGGQTAGPATPEGKGRV